MDAMVHLLSASHVPYEEQAGALEEGFEKLLTCGSVAVKRDDMWWRGNKPFLVKGHGGSHIDSHRVNPSSISGVSEILLACRFHSDAREYAATNPCILGLIDLADVVTLSRSTGSLSAWLGSNLRGL
ncbi:hypothetical protein GCM10022221_07100 [Actinocorallia aurea]